MNCHHTEADHAINQNLLHLIAHLQVLSYHTQLAHWHVQGPWFPSWHEMFSNHYEQLNEMIDTVAEHLRYRDGRLPATLKASIHHVNEPDFPTTGDEALLHHLLYLTQEIMIKYQNFMEICTIANLQTTLDILIEHSRAFEKMVWFYASSDGCPTHKNAGCI
jgi:starvation-inducible DNA-binding protein